MKDKKEVTQNTFSRKQRWGKGNRAVGVKVFGEKKATPTRRPLKLLKNIKIHLGYTYIWQ